MAFLSDLFDSITNQQATPQQTIIPTSELLGQGYSTATGLAPQVASLNAAYQPIITGNQLASENQVFGSAANQVQRGAYQSILDNLNLGNTVPADLQDLITTNTLQQLGASGIGSADAGKLFGARSLLSAGLDLGAQRRAEAMGASNALPSSRFQPGTVGIPDPMGIAGMIGEETAARDNFANLQEDIRRSNFSSLINTGGRILGTVAGGVAGYFTGNVAGGAMAGAEIGGRLGGQTGVAGVTPGGMQPSGGGIGGGGGGFTSILSGLFNQGPRYGAGGGALYTDGGNNVMQSVRASPVLLR